MTVGGIPLSSSNPEVAVKQAEKRINFIDESRS